MTKSVHIDVLDGCGAVIDANCNLMTACSAEPTTRAEAVTTYALADVAMSGADFTPAADGGGRKLTVGAKSAVPIDTTGMATHVALVDGTRLLYVNELGTVRQNTAQAGGATTITLDTGASAVDQYYQYMAITILSGTGVGQTRIITNYVGSTKVATVAAWSVNPDATSVFRIYGQVLTSGGTVDFPAFDICKIPQPT